MLKYVHACTGGLGVFARLLLQSSAAFMQVLARAEPSLTLPGASAGTQPGMIALLALLDLWLDKFDNIGIPHARKLSGLAMCVLLTVPLPAIMERLELIAACITSVWFEVRLLLAACRAFDFLARQEDSKGSRQPDCSWRAVTCRVT